MEGLFLIAAVLAEALFLYFIMGKVDDLKVSCFLDRKMDDHVVK